MDNFTEMREIGVGIFIDIKRDNFVFYIKRNSSRRDSATITMNKSTFTLGFIFNDESVNRSNSTIQFRSGTEF